MNRKQITHGVIGGLAGGLVFGILMGIMGMLPTIGKMVGLQSATIGFVVHMIISAIIGAEFSVVFGRFATRIGRSIAIGFAYGGLWWLLGPLTLMPLFMGMGLGVNWNLAAASTMLPSLMGHAIFGVVLSVVYSIIEHRAAFGAAAPAARLSTVEEKYSLESFKTKSLYGHSLETAIIAKKVESYINS